MNRFSIVNNYWNRKHGQFADEKANGPEEKTEYEEPEEDREEEAEEEYGGDDYEEDGGYDFNGSDMGEGSEMDSLIGDAQGLMEEFVEGHEGVAAAELSLVLDWAGGDMMGDERGSEGYSSMVNDENGGEHEINSDMWEQPESEDWERYEQTILQSFN